MAKNQLENDLKTVFVVNVHHFGFVLLFIVFFSELNASVVPESDKWGVL